MTSTRRVLLLHGLWMRPGSLALLDHRLRAAGFATERLGYSSVRGGPERAIDTLAREAARGACHVVAHSLGGLVTLAALERDPGLPVRRVVCLGSPLCGSAAADGVARLPMVGRTLGRSRELLRRGCAPWRGPAELGVVAGTLGFGLGRFVGRFAGLSDGTVALAETRLDGLSDHIAVHASHMGLVLSATVAAQVAAFLREGRFAR